MIDPRGAMSCCAARCGSEVAVIILDVFSGTVPIRPSRILAPECASVMAGGGPQIIPTCWNRQDPQAIPARESCQGGCIVTELRPGPAGGRRNRDRQPRCQDALE